jgi:glycosyltransferase involved in cell wall biosynthesis
VVANPRNVDTSSLRQSIDAAWLDQATCEVSIVFPCLNEASGVAECVHDAAARLADAGILGEVIVCDNGSSDGSERAAGQAGARVVNEAYRGYGSALRTGIRAARGEYIVILDADGSYDLAALAPIVAELRAGADLVMGNRFAGHLAVGAMPWAHRYIGSPLGRHGSN